MSDIIKTSKELISIESVTGAPTENAPYGKKTLEALEYMLKLGEKMGFKTKNIAGRCGYIEFGDGKDMIAAVGHLDVVPAGDGWDTPAFDATISDNKLIGRGAIDDKAPIVACLYAMKALKDDGVVPNKRIRIIMGLDEENGSSCMEYYTKHEKHPEMAFTPDGDFPVIFAEKGILRVEILGAGDKNLKVQGGSKVNMVPASCKCELNCTEKTFNGVMAHASLPELGSNAIDKAVQWLKDEGCENKLIKFLSQCYCGDFYGNKLGAHFSDDVSGSITFNLGIINIDNEKSKAVFDIRYPVTLDSCQVVSAISHRAMEYGLEVSITADIKPLYKDKESKLTKLLCNVYSQVTNEQASPIAIGGGTYAREVPNTLAFGPAFPNEVYTAHQANEFILLDSLEKCANIYKKALYELSK